MARRKSRKRVRMAAWEFVAGAAGLVLLVYLLRNIGGQSSIFLGLAVGVAVLGYSFWAWKKSPRMEETIILIGVSVGFIRVLLYAVGVWPY